MDHGLLLQVATVRRAKLGAVRARLAELKAAADQAAAEIAALETERSTILTAGQQTLRNERDGLFRSSFKISDMQGLRGTAEALFARVTGFNRRIEDANQRLSVVETERSRTAQILLRLQSKCDMLERIGRAHIQKQAQQKAERSIESDWSPLRSTVKA